MRKISRILGITGIFALAVTLSGCATVSVRAEVLDDTNAVVGVQQVITHEGFLEYLEVKKDAIENPLVTPEETEKPPAEEVAPDFTGTWAEIITEGTNPVNQELVIGSDARIYQISPSGARELFWAGTFTPPNKDALNYSWDSDWLYEEANNFLYKSATVVKFTWNDGVISYTLSGDLGNNTLVRFENIAPPVVAPPVEEAPTEEVPEKETPEFIIPTSDEELCELFKTESTTLLKLPKGIESSVECTDVDYAVTTQFPVTYGYAGVKEIAGVEADKGQVALLPFKLRVDAVYGDVVFEHRIMGLELGAFRTSTEWLEAVTDYNVSVSFPGEVTGSSNNGIQDTNTSVYWDYALVKEAVEGGDYVLTAAGRADSRVDPLPILATIGGVLFLLFLLVYFMWKRFSPRTIAITSFFLSPLSPFGFALALVARKKARNNADGARLAFVALIVSSASLVFQTLVVVLFFIMAPQIVTDIFSAMGLVSSSA